ncbi:hypothetical protein [Deinococcus sp. S9]|uniref:hypothetical protein n=1 Tax=Deinococcus sp. S9 TaxID=2545754 RepID=UPI001056C24A|nr:hypothetical protein [Deinococcus sp. S9]TDE87363.1 hypothetical protein E0686_02400 [Deinococcus sp. S9]
MRTDDRLAREVLDLAQPLDTSDINGAYFLIRDGRIVMAGLSVECKTRVQFHAKSGDKDFDSYAIVPGHASIADYVARIILEEEPEYNTRLPQNTSYITAKDAKDIYRIGKVEINAAVRSKQLEVFSLHGQQYFDRRQLLRVLRGEGS